nr:hypothetical protein HK105_003420 [Polyrhizophydium stewartii]
MSPSADGAVGDRHHRSDSAGGEVSLGDALADPANADVDRIFDVWRLFLDAARGGEGHNSVTSADRQAMLRLCLAAATATQRSPTHIQLKALSKMALTVALEAIAAYSAKAPNARSAALDETVAICDLAFVVILVPFPSDMPDTLANRASSLGGNSVDRLAGPQLHAAMQAAGMSPSPAWLHELVRVDVAAQHQARQSGTHRMRASPYVYEFLAIAKAHPGRIVSWARSLRGKPDVVLANKLLSLWSDRAWIDLIEELVNEFSRCRFVLSSEAMALVMRAHLRAGLPERALDMYRATAARTAGVQCSHAHVMAIKALLALQREDEALRLLDTFFARRLIQSQLRTSRGSKTKSLTTKVARDDFAERLPHRRVGAAKTAGDVAQFMFSALIDYFSTRNLDKACSLLSQMVAHGLQPNSIVRTCMVKAFVAHGKLDQALDVAWQLIARCKSDRRWDMQPHIFTLLVPALIRAGRTAEAQQLLVDMKALGISDNDKVLISSARALAQAGSPAAAVHLWRQMKPSVLRQSDAATAEGHGRQHHAAADRFSAIIIQLALLAVQSDEELWQLIQTGRQTFAAAPRHPLAVPMMTAIMTFLGARRRRTQLVAEGLRLFETVLRHVPIHRIDRRAFVAAIQCAARRGDFKTALDVYKLSRKTGIGADAFMFSSLIAGSTRGLLTPDPLAVLRARELIQEAVMAAKEDLDAQRKLKRTAATPANRATGPAVATAASSTSTAAFGRSSPLPSSPLQPFSSTLRQHQETAHPTINAVVCSAYLYACMRSRDEHAARAFWDEATSGTGWLQINDPRLGDAITALCLCLHACSGKAAVDEANEWIRRGLAAGAAFEDDARAALKRAGIDVPEE